MSKPSLEQLDKGTNNNIYFFDYLVFETFLCFQLIFLESNSFYDIANDNIEHETKNTYLKFAYTNITNISSFDTYQPIK